MTLKIQALLLKLGIKLLHKKRNNMLMKIAVSQDQLKKLNSGIDEHEDVLEKVSSYLHK